MMIKSNKGIIENKKFYCIWYLLTGKMYKNVYILVAVKYASTIWKVTCMISSM